MGLSNKLKLFGGSVMTKLDRLLYILNKLDRGEKVSPADLAEELGVSERTIYRYINSLIDAGFPIYYNKLKHTYVFEKGFSLSKVLIKTEEALVLALSKKLLEPLFGKNIVKILNQIEQKVISTSEKFCSFEKVIKIQNVFIQPYIFELLRDIVRAIKEHQVVEIEYEHDPGENLEKREIEPYYVFFTGDFWYVEAWCRKKQAERTFALDKIRSWRLTDRYFLPKEEITSSQRVEEAFGPYVDEKKEEVIVYFSPEVKQYFLRKKWVKEQEEKELSNGWLEVKFRIRGIKLFKQWLYSWIPYFKIVSPRWLVEEVRKDLETAFKGNIN